MQMGRPLLFLSAEKWSSGFGNGYFGVGSGRLLFSADDLIVRKTASVHQLDNLLVM